MPTLSVFTRRTLLITATLSLTRIAESKPAAIRAVAFDAFAVFDPRPVTLAAEACFPGRGNDFVAAWRTRQFEYTWLRTLTGDYADFWQVTGDALDIAAESLNLRPTSEQRARLMQAFLALGVWSDARAALESLRRAGIRLILLSNFTGQMLDAAVERNGLVDLFEARLTTDRVHAYKPDPRAYRMGVDTLKLGREEIVFAAFAGWDAAGAKAFGYPTFWVNRLRAPVEKLNRPPDAAGPTLDDLVRFVLHSAE
jgi:2-haloacid dehalogenase